MTDIGGPVVEFFAVVGAVAGGGAAVGSMLGGAAAMVRRETREIALELAGVGALMVVAVAMVVLGVDRLGGLP